MQETRHQFRETLKELERQTLESLEMVIQQLGRALESVGYQDVELAGMVIAGDDGIDARYLEIHQGVLSLLARQAPVAGDLRILAALPHIIRCVERIGDQCVNIAKLVRLSSHEAPKDTEILGAIERMGQLASAQASQAKEAFATRNDALAKELVGLDGDIERLNRRIFYRGRPPFLLSRCRGRGRSRGPRVAMFMILVARCLERIAGNTIDIGEQTVFVVTGLFREFAGESQPA